MTLFVSAAANGTATQLVRLLGDSGVAVVLLDVGYGAMAEAIAAARACPALHIETHRVNTPGGIEVLASAAGADRLLFGSEAPACAIAPPLGMVRRADLPEPDRNRILGGNLAGLLGM
jgi:predicted TIM-barrel fold metal-dependent hydrolase